MEQMKHILDDKRIVTVSQVYIQEPTPETYTVLGIAKIGAALLVKLALIYFDLFRELRRERMQTWVP